MVGKTRDGLPLSMILFISIIALVYAVQNVMSPALERMSLYFGFGGTKKELGIVTFSFTLLSGISMVLFGYLADKVTRVRILLAGSLLYAIPSTMILLVPPGSTGYAFFFMLELTAGFGFGMVIPNIFSLIGDLVSRNDRSKGFSFFSIATLLGMAVGVGLGSAFADGDWRIAYGIIGVAGIATALMTIGISEPSRIGRDNLFLVDEKAVEYTYRIKISDLKTIFKKRSNIWLVINFVDTIPTGIIIFLLFTYLEEEHNVDQGIGLIFLAFVLMSTLVGTIVFGYITDTLYARGKRKARVLYALMANVAPIPFVFVGLLIPFKLPDGGTVMDLFMNPAAVAVLLLFVIGLFLNGATNGSWYATVVDINLPEHRGTVLSTANFFDILGKSLGPLIGSLVADALGTLAGMAMSIIFWVFLPFFWIPVLRHVEEDMDKTKAIFDKRLGNISRDGGS